MRKGYISIIIGVLLILLVTQAYGLVATYPFRERAQKSDLIVEGVVEKQIDIRGYDLQDLRSFRKKSLFKVSKVYKGNIAEGNSITVFSHMNFLCDTSRILAEGRRYLLMLKAHESGFADVSYGRGMWEIVTLEPQKQFVAGYLWLKTWGKSYEEFQENLAWALLEPPSWPEKPTISFDQALEIALQKLSEQKIDVKTFELNKKELINIAGDIIGIAYKDDPMWYFRWTTPEAKKQGPSLQKTVMACYIHAYTGKFYPKSPPKIPSAEIVCRLFLKTHPNYRQIYSKHVENINISQITEKEFRSYLRRLQNTFLKVKTSYPENTTFLKVGFPDNVGVNPVILVLNAAGHIDFAGIIRPKI